MTAPGPARPVPGRGRAVVIGLGRSGRACATVLAAEGYDVLAVDREDTPALRETAAALTRRGGIDVSLGGYPAGVAAGAALVCPSPGVRWDAPELEAARAGGVPVRSEIALVLERCTARVAGITGTNGKTTTATLTADILRRGGLTTHLGGNVGVTVLDRLGDLGPDDWLVLELSSFQLETVAEPRTEIGAVLNVAPDHLDRHGSLDAYAATKERLARFAATAVLNAGDETVRRMGTPGREAGGGPRAVRWFGGRLPAGAEGATVDAGTVVAVEEGVSTPILPVADIPLFGDHNVANVLAAVCIARRAGVAPPAIAAAVRSFRAVAHRLEPVHEEGGVLWVDDSKATNTASAVTALRSFPGRPVVWIGGGTAKGVGPGELAAEVAARARVAIACGATGPALDAALGRLGFAQRRLVATLAEAVGAAREVARPGDVVLLAPGYASFDQFTDFEERGRVFAELARRGRAA